MSGDREKLVASTTVVLASWAICGLSYAAVPPGDSGVISLFVFLAGSLTLTAAYLVVAAWRGQAPVGATLPVAVLTAGSVLWVALLLQLGNH